MGLGPAPQNYHHLTFSPYFSAFRPGDPALARLISDDDLNCAVSSPQSLLGSRTLPVVAGEAIDGATFSIANATSIAQQGLQPYFTLKTFSIKPMVFPPPETTMTVKGYSHFRNETYDWHVDFPSGYHAPLSVDMRKFAGREWDLLYAVEIRAEYGVGKLDWEFCLDDLEVQFIETPKSEHRNQRPLRVMQAAFGSS